MHEIAVVLQALSPFSFFAFAVSFIAMIVANRYIAAQNVGAARVWTLVSAISASVVLVFQVALFAVTLSPFAAFMILVWGYFSYISWRQYGRLG